MASKTHTQLARWMTSRYRCSLETQTDTKMTDRYRCGTKNWNWIQVDKKMVDQYRCGPKTLTKLTRWMIDGYRCGPENSNSYWTNKKMTNRYRCGPEAQVELNWHDEWLIDIDAWSKYVKYENCLTINWFEVLCVLGLH